MSLVELESLVVVAQEQHLGKAAKRLSVSQPPLTRRIQRLEAELQFQVFERSAKGMRLRPQAIGIVHQAQRVLDEVHRLKSITQTLRRTNDPPIAINPHPSIAGQQETPR